MFPAESWQHLTPPTPLPPCWPADFDEDPLQLGPTQPATSSKDNSEWDDEMLSSPAAALPAQQQQQAQWRGLTISDPQWVNDFPISPHTTVAAEWLKSEAEQVSIRSSAADSRSEETPLAHEAAVRSRTLSLPLPSTSPSSSAAPAAAATATTAEAQTKLSKIIGRACSRCHRLKSACDDVRPCARCVRAGCACVERAEEEGIKEAAARRRAKRPVAAKEEAPKPTSSVAPPHSSSIATNEPRSSPASTPPTAAASAAAAAAAAAATGISSAEVDALSMSLCSRTFLALAIELSMRDTVLQTHAQVTALRPPISTLVEWHTQVALMCLYLSEMLSMEDFLAFLTSGLTEAELNSPNFLSSPLAPWTHLSTRPLHFTFQPNTTLLNNYLAGATLDAAATHNDGAASEDGVDEALLRFEWLPSAHVAFQNWQNALETRLRADQQLQETRQSMFASSYGESDQSGAGFRVGDSTPPPTLSPEEDLSIHLITVGIGRALSSRPPLTTPNDYITSVHARWCPLGDPNAQHDDADASKVKRTTGMGCVRSSDGSGDEAPSSSDPQPECCCFGSSPLPLRIFANEEFHRVFGWRRIDVELGFQQEGIRWNRRWVSDDERRDEARSDELQQPLEKACRSVRHLISCVYVLLLFASSPSPSLLLPCGSARIV